MGRRKGKGKARKGAVKGQAFSEPDDVTKAPHTFIIYRGQVGKNVAELTRDFRRVMEPYTASKLKVLKSNKLKDFVSVAGPLNVTHMVIFSKSMSAIFLRITRLPRGPTMTFRLQNYTLARDVLSSLKKPITYAKQFLHHPLLILNNFGGEGKHMKLMATMFQNLFPSINVHKIKLNSIRRCVLLNYNEEENLIDFRQYTVKVTPTGMSRCVKKLIQSKIPNLSNCDDISEYITGGGGNLSESEAELDDATNRVALPQQISSRGNMTSEQSSIRLIEMGPRLTLQLIKIEDGLIDGEVLYHSQITKSPEEIEFLRSQKEKKKKLREKRRKQQEANVRAKQDARTCRDQSKVENSERQKSQKDEEFSQKKQSNGDLSPIGKRKRTLTNDSGRVLKRRKVSNFNKNAKPTCHKGRK